MAYFSTVMVHVEQIVYLINFVLHTCFYLMYRVGWLVFFCEEYDCSNGESL